LSRLCAGTTNYLEVCGGGSALLQRLEVSGYLAGLSRPAMLMAQAKYMSDDNAVSGLYGYVTTWLNGLNNHEGWGCIESDRRIATLASMSLIEVVRPARCPTCGGVGFRMARVCLSCNGTGFKPLSKQQIANAMDMHHETFRRRWAERFNRTVSWLRGFDADVNRAVSRANWDSIIQD